MWKTEIHQRETILLPSSSGNNEIKTAINESKNLKYPFLICEYLIFCHRLEKKSRFFLSFLKNSVF